MSIDHAPTLVGERITLRAPVVSDAEKRSALGEVREIVRAFGGDIDHDQPMSIDRAARELAYRFGPGPHWVIADSDDNSFIGVARLAPIDVENRSGRFAIGILDPAKLGQGLGTEATLLVLDHGFATLGLHRVDLKVLADNTRAIRAYERCGFEREGRLRHTLWRDGAWLDDLIMAIVAVVDVRPS